MALVLTGGISHADAAQFWARVDRSEGAKGCWYLCRVRYGRLIRLYGRQTVKINGKTELAYRAAWKIDNNRPIPKGLVTCHTCDNSSCINPNRLKLDTSGNNSKEMVGRGRAYPRGKHLAARWEQSSDTEIPNSGMLLLALEALALKTSKKGAKR